MLMKLPARDSEGNIQEIHYRNSQCNDSDCDCGRTKNIYVEFANATNDEIKHLVLDYDKPTEADARAKMLIYLL